MNIMDKAEMGFWDHVVELRRRLLVCAATLTAATVACFFFVEPAAQYLMEPVGNMTFVFLSPPELFMSYVRIALIGAVVLSSPVILFQLWMFVKPGLEKRERRALIWGLIFGALFFAAGSGFAFFVIIPFSIRFFLQYQNESIQAMFSFAEYVGFVGSMVLSFGVAFELPIATSILAALGIVKGSAMAAARRYAVLLIFVGAAIITPPDVVSQVLLAVPMVLLFELSVIIAKRHDKRRAKREELEALEAT
jgi:sec-independent protein translocase protein TatC